LFAVCDILFENSLNLNKKSRHPTSLRAPLNTAEQRGGVR